MTKKRCWMCDSEKRSWKDGVERLIEEGEGYFVVVPWGYLVEGHILIIHGQEGGQKGSKHMEWKDADEKALSQMNAAVSKWRNILLEKYKCDNVMMTCLCDKDPHLHYHLIPTIGKARKGKGHIWLGVRETESVILSPPSKKKRREVIKRVVELLKTYAG